jgi:hypothetical protein
MMPRPFAVPIIVGLAVLTACHVRQAPTDQIYAQNRCGGASSLWRPFDSPAGDLEPLTNKVEINASTIRWNDQTVSRTLFNSLAAAAGTMNPVPGVKLVLHANAACDPVQFARTTLERELHCSELSQCQEFSEKEWAWRYQKPPPCDEKCRANSDIGVSDDREEP